jgi:hypothetical protein
LREAVEELERRLQTNYERTALLARSETRTDRSESKAAIILGSAPGNGALGGNPDFENIDESECTFTRARDEEVDDNPEQIN